MDINKLFGDIAQVQLLQQQKQQNNNCKYLLAFIYPPAALLSLAVNKLVLLLPVCVHLYVISTLVCTGSEWTFTALC